MIERVTSRAESQERADEQQRAADEMIEKNFISAAAVHFLTSVHLLNLFVRIPGRSHHIIPPAPRYRSSLIWLRIDREPLLCPNILASMSSFTDRATAIEWNCWPTIANCVPKSVQECTSPALSPWSAAHRTLGRAIHVSIERDAVDMLKSSELLSCRDRPW